MKLGVEIFNNCGILYLSRKDGVFIEFDCSKIKDEDLIMYTMKTIHSNGYKRGVSDFKRRVKNMFEENDDEWIEDIAKKREDLQDSKF